MKKIIFVFLLLALAVANISAQVVTLDSLHKLDANGVTLLVGQTVTVTGIVTTHQELGPPLVYLQSGTAGVAAYDATFGAAVTRGDSVVVTGVVTNYGGLIELQPVSSFTVVSQNKTVTPVVVTPSDVRNNGELYESRLIKINGITAVKNTSGVPVTTWTTSASGTNYRIFVGTDSCDIRIYTSTNIAGTVIPAFPFNVVAVSSQYKSATPFFGGYQIIPRDLADFTTSSPGPQIAAIPVESNITPTSVTLTYGTLTNGNTKVKYFVNDSLGQPIVYTDSVFSDALTTTHIVTLTNLKPGQIYYATVYSTDGTGTSSYGPKYFATASHPSSRGLKEFYFNYSVDTSKALPNNKANGSADFKIRLGQRIDSATKSIDMAIYSFDDLTYLKDKIINAFIRGVKIRVVYDYRNGTPQALMQYLIDAGIKVQIRPSDSYIMHNKFLIFDSRDTTSYSDDWLWAGSSNITNDQFYKDVNNCLLVQDETLCKIYTREFEQMWGSHNDNNSPANGKFGPAKVDVTPSLLNINGKKVEVYFSPSDDLSTRMQNLITAYTDKSINFSILTFTVYNIANRMKAKYNPPNLMVRGIFDYSGTQNPSSNMVWVEMKGISGTVWNPPARVYAHNPALYSGGQYHHKYLLLDADSLTSNPITWVGSYNFSSAATVGNDENALIFYDSLVTNQYYQEFAKRFVENGGSIGVQTISSEIPSKYSLSQNFPNPFNPVTNIEFSIPKNDIARINVYDVTGREVAVLFNNYFQAGTYKIQFDAGNLSSGVYFYKLTTGSYTETRKLMLLK